MISFKQFLQERAMNSGEFKKVLSRQGSRALAGFEFEMVVKKGSAVHGADGKDPQTKELRNIQMSDLDGYFSGSYSRFRAIERDYDEWVENTRSEWVDANLEKFAELDDDGNMVDEDAAREEAEQMFNRREDTSAEFYVKEMFGSLYELIRRYSLEPHYGWADDRGDDYSEVYAEEVKGDEDNTYKKMMADLKYEIDTKGWEVTSDGSIDAGQHVGAELISPPLPLAEALADLQAVFAWMEKHNIETNSSTGLHINLSMPGIKKVDPVKLVLFMGETYALDMFNRVGNIYTKSQVETMIGKIRANGYLPKDADTLRILASTTLDNSKYFSVNLSKLSQNYLEFRVAGGKGYHKRGKDVVNTVLRFVSALEIACDPDLERQEYLKKLAKLFDAALKPAHNVQYAKRSIVDMLMMAAQDRVANQLKEFKELLKASGKPAKAETKQWFLDKAIPAIAKAHATVAPLSSRQLMELQQLAKLFGIDLKQLSPEVQKSIGFNK